MAKHILGKNKGQSLVEVVVALGVIAIVFSGTVTLIVRVVGLNLNARDVTQATALTQKKLAEAVSGTASGCTSTLPGSSGSVSLGNKNFDFAVTSNFYDIGTNGTATANVTGDFLKIVSTVTWRDRESNLQTNVMEQFVRRSQ